MAAQIAKERVALLLLEVRTKESFHIESVVLHHKQVVEDVDAVVLEYVELRQFIVLT
jgi:hypothetical protein